MISLRLNSENVKMKQRQIDKEKVETVVSRFIENCGDLERMMLCAQNEGVNLSLPQLLPPLQPLPFGSFEAAVERTDKANKNIALFLGCCDAKLFEYQYMMALALSEEIQEAQMQRQSACGYLKRKFFEAMGRVDRWVGQKCLNRFYIQLQSIDPVSNYMAIRMLGSLERAGVSLDPYVSEQLKRV